MRDFLEIEPPAVDADGVVIDEPEDGTPADEGGSPLEALYEEQGDEPEAPDDRDSQTSGQDAPWR